MVKITEIKKLKRLYKMTFDDFFELEDADETDKLYICEDTIVHFMLSRDKELTLPQLEALVKFDNFAQGKALALYYLSFKARSTAEVEKYLQQHDIHSAQIEQVLSNLTENGLLNDSAYALNFIQGKIALESTGPYQIKQKLRTKGLADEVIADALDELYDEDIQLQVAQKLAEKLVRQKSDQLTLSQLEQKIKQNLITKGFSYAIADQTLAELALESDEENERELLEAELDRAARRYSRNYEGYDLKNHITQALARKGFDFGDISDALRDYDFDD